MKITVCIGSSCHLKGSKQVIEQIENLINDNKLANEIELCGTFCMGNCEKGVCVKIADQQFSVQPENVEVFFKNEVLRRI